MAMSSSATDPALDAAPSRKDSAGLILHRWIIEQVAEMERLDPVTCRAAPGGVHRMRKACRRLRAALATYRPLLDRERTDPVREELRWLARSLGSARDDEVVLERISRLLDDEPAGVSAVAAARRVLERYAVARASEDASTLETVLSSDRYFALRTSLDELAAAPPWSRPARKDARDVLPARVRKEWKRLRRSHEDSGDPHEVRKAAKRLRYAYEVVEPAWGKDAARPRKAARELTRVLGDRQDTLVARDWLVALSSEAGRSDDSAFVFGRLHAREEGLEGELLERAEAAWRELKKLRW
jgi:CHAD domain-containing protein